MSINPIESNYYVPIPPRSTTTTSTPQLPQSVVTLVSMLCAKFHLIPPTKWHPQQSVREYLGSALTDILDQLTALPPAPIDWPENGVLAFAAVLNTLVERCEVTGPENDILTRQLALLTADADMRIKYHMSMDGHIKWITQLIHWFAYVCTQPIVLRYNNNNNYVNPADRGTISK
jgi:hypothetical protein